MVCLGARGPPDPALAIIMCHFVKFINTVAY